LTENKSIENAMNLMAGYVRKLTSIIVSMQMTKTWLLRHMQVKFCSAADKCLMAYKPTV